MAKKTVVLPASLEQVVYTAIHGELLDLQRRQRTDPVLTPETVRQVVQRHLRAAYPIVEALEGVGGLPVQATVAHAQAEFFLTEDRRLAYRLNR